jgi:hypothetical protein
MSAARKRRLVNAHCSILLARGLLAKEDRRAAWVHCGERAISNPLTMVSRSL